MNLQRVSRLTGRAVAAVCIVGITCQCVPAAPGSSGAQFLKIGVGARSGALGETAAVLAGPESLFGNPACIARVTGVEVSLSQAMWLEDISYSNIAGVYRRDANAFGCALGVLGMPAITKYDNTGLRLDESYTPQDSVFAFGYARRINARAAAGLALKRVAAAIDDVTASAFALDAGMWKGFKYLPLELGLAVRNIGSEMKFSSAGDPLPMTVKAGGSYTMRLRAGTEVRHSVGLLADMTYVNDSGMYQNLGVEYVQRYGNRAAVAVRAGYKTNVKADESALAMGVGLRYGRYALDYAFAPYGDLGETHRVSVILGFGGETQTTAYGVNK